MPRPKGSKNKVKTLISLEEVTLRIENTEAEIEEIKTSIKNKKAELKALKKELIMAQEAAETIKAEEEKARILEAVMSSGKSMDEILELLR